MSEYRRFLVPYDFSEHARAALYAGADLARRLGAELHLVHVVHQLLQGYALLYGGPAPPPSDTLQLRDKAMETLNQVARDIEELPNKLGTHVLEGSDIAEAITEAAGKMGADLIVMGTHGHTGLARVFLGSVAERTLRQSTCPVLTVKAPEEDGAARGAWREAGA